MAILTFFTFPLPTVCLEAAGRTLFAQTCRSAPGDVALGRLVEAALAQGVPLTACATFSGPGPFAALRVMRAFMEGFVLGRPQLPAFMPSLYEVFEGGSPRPLLWVIPQSPACAMAVDSQGVQVLKESEMHRYPGYPVCSMDPAVISDEEAFLLANFLLRYVHKQMGLGTPPF